MILSLFKDQKISREEIKKFVALQYKRNDHNFVRGTFRLRGDIVEFFLHTWKHRRRIEMFGNTIETINEVDFLTGKKLNY